MSTIINNDLLDLKTKLESIETQLDSQIKDLEIREEKWKKMDDQVNTLIKTFTDKVVKFNVGGKKFATKVETITNVKDSLFSKIAESGRFDLSQEIFFDRSPKIFQHILDYLRTQNINYKRFKKEELDELRIEAEYYELDEITTYLEDRMKEIEFEKYEVSGHYMYNNAIVGGAKVSDLKDRSLTTGVCANSPGWIVIELNNTWEFTDIEIAGFNGNPNAWYAGNGSGATILTSTDKIDWKTVGTIPSNYGQTIQTVKLTKSSARYIKFNHNSYCGLGYLNIKKL
jgi:hypothetical protein